MARLIPRSAQVRKIAAVEATQMSMTFQPDVAPHMRRAATHGSTISLYRVILDNGVDGYGDPLPNIAILKRICAAFDPTGKLSPGRLPGAPGAGAG